MVEQELLPPATPQKPGTTKCDDFPLEADISPIIAAEMDRQNIAIMQAIRMHYTRKNEDNTRYKKVFFWVVITILLAITAGFIAICVSLFFYADRWQIVIPVMGGGAITVVTALLKLPEIIANYLFPKAEDQALVDLVKALKDVE